MCGRTSLAKWRGIFTAHGDGHISAVSAQNLWAHLDELSDQSEDEGDPSIAVKQFEYDPIEGGYTGGGTTEYPLKVAPPGTFDNEYIDGTLVQRSDLRVTVPAASLPFVPAIAASDTQDAIEIDGTIYSVIAVSPAYAGESVATYELQVRG